MTSLVCLLSLLATIHCRALSEKPVAPTDGYLPSRDDDDLASYSTSQEYDEDEDLAGYEASPDDFNARMSLPDLEESKDEGPAMPEESQEKENDEDMEENKTETEEDELIRYNAGAEDLPADQPKSPIEFDQPMEMIENDTEQKDDKNDEEGSGRSEMESDTEEENKGRDGGSSKDDTVPTEEEDTEETPDSEEVDNKEDKGNKGEEIDEDEEDLGMDQAENGDMQLDTLDDNLDKLGLSPALAASIKQCPGMSMSVCVSVCPGVTAKVYGACVQGCAIRCESEDKPK